MLRLSRVAAESLVVPRNNRVVIGYVSGTPTHDACLSMIRVPLLSVMRKYRNVELWLAGPIRLPGGLNDVGERIRLIPYQHWQKLPNVIAQFDINIAPWILTEPFYQSKSEVKYIESALVKVPTAASPIESFRYAIRQEENGMLVETPEAWKHVLLRLIENPKWRRDMGEKAYKDVLERYHPDVRGRELIESLNVVTGLHWKSPLFNAPPDGTPCPANDTFSFSSGTETPPPSLFRRVWYALRYRGPLVTCLQTWVYLADLLSKILKRDH
jgi:hypothetical protein